MNLRSLSQVGHIVAIMTMIMAGDLLAASWTIQSPSNDRQYSLTAGVSTSGTTDQASTGFTLEVYKDYDTNPVVMNSATGTSTAMGSYFSGTVNPPTGGWTATNDGALSLTGANGGSAIKGIKFVP